MTQDEHELSPELADWLVDAGRRRFPSLPADPPESSEDVLAYLEQLTGRRLRSRAAIGQFLGDLAADEARRAQEVVRRRTIRDGLLLVLLAASYLHYYYWDTNLKIALLPEMKVFVPIKDRDKGINTNRQKAKALGPSLDFKSALASAEALGREPSLFSD